MFGLSIGKNTLSNMMQRISEKSNLSQTYTCHSVLASCITTLFLAGVSTEQIISITKHMNTSSLKHYILGLSMEQKAHCSTILSASIFEKDINQSKNSENSAPVINIAASRESSEVSDGDNFQE